MDYKIKKHLALKLLGYYRKSLTCSACYLPSNYSPQIGLIGKDYDYGGIVFMQINPGSISALTEKEINNYKSERNRKIARDKVKSDTEWLLMHQKFIKSPSIDTLNHLNQVTRKSIESWGWPQGKYIKVLEKHGAKVDSSALLNMAQCPVIKDKYTSKMLIDCWELNTRHLLDILKPGLIIAQGKKVFELLENYSLKIPVIEGVHHASRKSSYENDIIISRVIFLTQTLSNIAGNNHK